MIGPSFRGLAGAMALSAALAGCTVGPNYERPQLPAPDQFRFIDGPAQAQALQGAFEQTQKYVGQAAARAGIKL